LSPHRQQRQWLLQAQKNRCNRNEHEAARKMPSATPVVTRIVLTGMIWGI
jgi:hypothetical protein